MPLSRNSGLGYADTVYIVGSAASILHGYSTPYRIRTHHFAVLSIVQHDHSLTLTMIFNPADSTLRKAL